MSIYTRKKLECFVGCVLVVCITAPVEVLGWKKLYDPNGDHIRLTHEETVRIANCSMYTTHVDAVQDAVWTWNDPTGILNLLIPEESSLPCSNVSWNRTDDQSWIIGFPGGDPRLEGHAGIIRCDTYVSTGKIKTFDIGFNRDAVTTVPDERTSYLSAREILIHEFGHAMGIDDHNDPWSVMCPAGTCGKTGKMSHQGTTHNLANYETIFPDDLAYLVAVHSDSSSGTIDPFTSAWRINDTTKKPERIYSDKAEENPLQVCRGQSINVTFTLGNKGKQRTPQIDYGIFFSSDKIIAATDFQGRWGWIDNYGNEQNTIDRPVTVPNNLIPGQSYYVGVIIDYNNAYSEDIHYNNSSYLGLKVTVKTTGC